MRYDCERHPLACSDDWDDLAAALGEERDVSSHKLLGGLIDAFRRMGARCCLKEVPYIDRDFTALYMSFYASLYQPYLKYCERLHFFADDLADFDALAADPSARASLLEAHGEDYLGFVVLRPLRHAPVSAAVASARHLTDARQQVSIRSPFAVHLLGAELVVEGAPITEQDTMNGVCAQAAIWMALRHLHNRHAAAWVSTTDITEAALKPVDSQISRSLPAGSESLGADNITRALRAAGEHPLVYTPTDDGEWKEPPHRIVGRHLESGLPIIIGLNAGKARGHAVLAVGAQWAPAFPACGTDGAPNAADRMTHLLVNDDQHGAYKPLPVHPSADGRKGDSEFDLTQADVIFAMLPKKVFMAAESAERIARESVALISANRAEHVIEVLGDQAAQWSNDVDTEFHNAPDEEIVARTYLTFGWKYKQRIVRNEILDDIKFEVLATQLPRYVWVTEFCLRKDLSGRPPDEHLIRAHVVVDATGSNYWDSLILTHVPGIAVFKSFDATNPKERRTTIAMVFQSDRAYRPKVRGRDGRRSKPETPSPGGG